MEYLSSPPCFSWVNRSFVLCFVDRCLSFCPFSICHCGACASSYYRFWLPLWCLQTVLHQVHSKLKDLTSVPFAQISQSKAKWQFKRISPTVFHLKDDQHRSKYSVLRRDNLISLKQHTLILAKCSLKSISGNKSSFYVCYVWWTCSSIDSLHFHVHKLRSSCWLGFYSYVAYFIQVLLIETERKLARSFNFAFRYIDGSMG
jgi:hypothetical protein